MAAEQGSEQRIYINGRFLDQPLSGVQRYARQMVAALDQLIGSHQVEGERWCLLTTGREIARPQLDHIEVHSVESKFHGHAWEQFALARAARDGTLLGLAGSGPITHPRQLVVIHDASVFRNPRFFSRRYGLWHRWLGRALARRARIGTVSSFSQRELADVLNLDERTIPVLRNGSDHMLLTAPSLDAYDRLNLRGRNIFILIGNLTRNKNVGVAIEAMNLVPNAVLVIIGDLNSRIFGKLHAKIDSERVVLVGRLDDESTVGLLREAKGLLFPSFYEGFGIPPLEAMVNSCPVIASAIDSVREICGAAALYFNPTDPVALAAAMRALLNEGEGERQQRVQRGLVQAARYTWQQSASALIDFYREELADKGR